METITSRQNPTVKLLRRLASGRSRGESDPAYVEGILPLLRALHNGVPVRLIAYAPDLLRSEVAQAAVARAREQGIRCSAFSQEVFASFSRRDNPVGLAGLVESQWTPLDRLQTDGGTVTVLHEVKDPGNLGTIIRTIDATAGQGMVLLGETADPYHPSSIRASVGTVFAVPIARATDNGQLLAWCRSRGATLVATSAQGGVELHQTQRRGPLAVMLGSEARGLPPELLAAAELTVTLPMHGQASSLNLAVAAGIILYELKHRQAGAASQVDRSVEAP